MKNLSKNLKLEVSDQPSAVSGQSKADSRKLKADSSSFLKLETWNLKLFLLLFVLLMIALPAEASTVDLPRTGQTTSYAAGDDGAIQAGVAWPDPRFTVGTGAEADCITDNLTGLMWVKNPDSTTRTWSDALTYVNDLSLCGYSDWRLPNVNELESLINAGASNTTAWLNTQGFSNVQASYYWSSTTWAFNTGNASVILMGDGGVLNDVKGDSNYVWPVRAATSPPAELWETGQTTCYDSNGSIIVCSGTGQDGDIQVGVAWPSPRFTDSGNGTVTDNLTGLIWLKDANCFGTKIWDDALTAANTLANSQCGLSDDSSAGDWRLPNIKELRSLVDYSQINPALPDGHPFFNVQSDVYWSSSTRVAYAGNSWYVTMFSGYVSNYNKSFAYYVWPVRAGQFTLNISKSGTGSGTVTSSPSGIDCGSDCSEAYTSGTIVTLSPTPDAGSTFSGWSGDCDVNGQVTMNGNKTCTATFDTIGLDATPPVTTASPAGGTYSSAQSVTLTCSDGTGSGCKTTNYCLGSGCTPVTDYTTPISISNSTDLRFYSIDFADNSEAIKTETYTISGGSESPYQTLWTRQMGTATDEIAYGVAVDSSGNAYVTGRTFGGLDGNTSAGGYDIFLTKYDTNGNKLWTRQMGTATDEIAYGVAVDSGGNVYVTGYTGGGLDGNTSAGSYDIFLVKYDTNGNKLWTRQMGTASEDYAFGVAVDSGGNVYVTGYTGGGLDGNTNQGGYGDLFLVKYDTNGNKLWTRQMGTANNDYAYGVAVDSSGNAYVAGVTYGGLDGNTSAGSYDLFLVKYDSNGTKLWTRQMGTSLGDYAEGVAVDSGGNAYVAGETGGGLDGNTNAGSTDLFLVKYDTNGTKLWTQQMGTSAGDLAFGGVAVDTSGNAYVAGVTYGGLDGNTNAGSADIFVMKLGDSVIDLPRTGQTTSYAAGDDGAIQAGVAWPSPRLTDNSDQTITDNLTGLMWTKDAGAPTAGSCTGGTKTWQGALDYVACLNTNNYLGHTDWRLPNVNELESLIHGGQSNPASWLNTQGFASVQAGYYWSSTTYVNLTDYAMVVNMMSEGGLYIGNKSNNNYYVWPVRAGQSAPANLPKTGQTTVYATGDDGGLQTGVAWPSPRFTNADSTTPVSGNVVVDQLTGLMWNRDGGTPTVGSCTGGYKTWQGALDYVACLNTNSYLGYNDWRLPNRKELRSLINYGQSNNASWLNAQVFNSVQAAGYYWSSTTYVNLTDYAMVVNMDVGGVLVISKSTSNYLWPVRGGSGMPDTTPPTGTITINSGATSTDTTSVTLTLTCTDASGCAEMKFSNDNSTFSTAETYATSKSWTLISGDGTKTVYAKFKDNAGNWSSAYSDTIVLDTFAPPGSGGRAWRRPLYDIGGTSFYPYASSPNSGALNLQWNKTAVENVLTADINGDGFLEVIASTGSALLVYDKGGNVLWSTPTVAKLSYIGDADGDGNFEIFTTYKDVSNSLKMDVYSGAGSFIKTITWGTGGYDSSWYVIHNKGDKLVAVNEAGYSLSPRGVSFLSYSSGSLLSFYGQGPCTWVAAVEDINNDGLLEVATSTYTCHNGANANGTSDNNMYGIVTNENGVNVFTKIITDWDPTTSPDGALYWAFADMNNDNVPEMIAFESHDPTYYHGTNHVYLINNSGQKLKQWVGPVDGEFGSHSIADINGDGYKDIVVQASANSGIIYALDKDMNLITQSPAGVGKILAVNDFDGDGQNEVIVHQASSGRVRVLKGDLSTEVASYIVGPLTLAPRDVVLSDIDNDGKNELIVAADSGLYVLGPTPSETTPPTGTVSINSGATYTNTTSVTLTLSCSDASGCAEMQFSNDNTNWSTAEAYATSKSWTLSSGDGTKTVYVKFKDTAGNWSSAYSDTIGLETVAPTGTISINSGSTYTNSIAVTLTLTCNDSGSGCAEMKFSNDNVTYSTAEAYATSKAWTLSSGDGTKTVYAKFKDTAGNWSSAYSDTIVLDTTISAPSNIEANQNGNKGELVITWTKPADSDLNHIHIYRSTTSGVLGSLIADNQTGIKYIDTGLASQTTYYYTVRAVDNLGNESTNTKQYSGTTLDATPPGVPSNITATDAGTGGKINLSWTNPADSDFSHIHIYRSASSGSLGSLIYDNVTGTSKSDTGITNGVAYYYTVRAVDTSDNETTNTAQVSATPTAPDVTAPGAVSSVNISDPATGGALNISWTNPADGDFAKVRIYRSTTSGQLGSLVYEVTGTSVTDTGLTSGTTYYYTFHTVDNLGNESSHTTQHSGMPTDKVAPNPVTELTATLLSGGKVKLDWIRSSSDDINYYNIYYDNGTGTIDYTTAIASVQHPTVTWTSGALTVGTRYQFAIRAEDTSLNKETNTNVISVVPVTDPNAGDVSASIKVPQTGKKVCGNMVTVMAELLMGTVADTQEIRLQYKTAASGTWSDIPSTDPAKFPNPDTTSPYFVHWNVTTLTNGDYNLRAVATSNALVTDSNPSYITITVDSVNCSSQETTNAGGEKTKAEDVSKNASSNSVMAGSTGVTTVALPEGSLDADTKINITESDPATKAGLVPSGYSNGSSFNEIGFESGQTTLANNKKATVEIPYYKDNDNNGIVDGTSVKVYDLQVCDYNSGTGWTCLDSLVDTDKKTVKAKTEKFSLFGLLMPPKPVGAEWNLLSVPLQPSPNTPSAVFGSVTNYTNYVLWWNPSIEDYQIVSTIETGKSYWVWGNGNNLTTVSGIETPNSNFSISIKKGWNMVGHPFRYKGNVSDLWIYYGGNYYTIADAETNGWVVATVYKYENGAYQFQTAQDGGVLEAWEGYWILSDIDCTLIIPPTPAQ